MNNTFSDNIETSQRIAVRWLWIFFLLLMPALGLGAEEAAEAVEAAEPGRIELFYSWVEGLGYLGLVVYAGAYIGATVLFIPGSALTIGAGLLFGIVEGSVIVSIGSTTGAALAFLISRYLARERIENRFGRNPKFKAIDSAIGRQGGKIILLLRLTPLLPFNLSNYLYGLTAVRFWPYVLASWIGMMPATVLYVYIGSLGKTAAEASTGGMDSGKLALNIVAFLATVAVTVYVTRIARKALKEANLEDGPAQAPETSPEAAA